jgi:tetratricopeptide (TPR) repeat protein
MELAVVLVVLVSLGCRKTRDTVPERVLLSVKTAEEAVRRGKQAKEAGKTSEEIQWFTRAIQLDPNCVEGYAGRGCASFKEFDRGLSDLNKAVELHTQNPMVFAARGLLRASTSEWDSAIQDLTMNLEMIERRNYILCFDEEHADLSDFIDRWRWCNSRKETYLIRAWAYLEMDHDFDKAQADVQASRRMGLDLFDCVRIQTGSKTSRKMNLDDPNSLRKDLMVYLRDPNRLNVWSEARRKDALKRYSEALAENPADVQVRRNRGDLHFYAGHFNEAISDWSRVLELVPYDAWTYLWRGNAFLRSGDVDRAEADFLKATECDPTLWHCHFALAYGFAAHGRIHEAAARIIVCRGLGKSVDPRFLDLLPPSSEGYDRLGLEKLREQLDRLNELITDESAVDRRLQPSTSDLLFAYRSTEALARPALDGLVAIKRFSRAIELDPCYPAAYCLRGDAYVAGLVLSHPLLSQPLLSRESAYVSEYGIVSLDAHRYLDLAIQDYGMAIKLCPHSPTFYVRRAIARIVKGQLDYRGRHCDNAISDCTSAIGLDPSCPEAYNTRAEAYCHKGEYGRAINDLQALHRLGYCNSSRLALLLFLLDPRRQGTSEVTK